MISKMRENLKKREGFTLIELLVVVAIIGILAAIAIPQYAKYRERAARATAVSDAKNIANSIEAYYSDYESYPASLDDDVIVVLGDETFSLSKNNSFVDYARIGGTAYTFSISNTVYNKIVTYDSTKGGVDASVW